MNITAIRLKMKLQDVDQELCTLRSSQGASRTRLGERVLASMLGTELSKHQQRAYQQLLVPDSVVAVTGQQVGLFGGPMYTLYKIRSAVAAASIVSQQTGVPCIPLFWVEDNDHDAHEAMHAEILTGTHDVLSISPWDGAHPRRRVADRLIDQALHDAVVPTLQQLQGRCARQTIERLQDAYQVGTTWTDAFLTVLAPYLAEWGVLVVCSSKLVDVGLHSPILQYLLNRNDEVVQTIKTTTMVLQQRGTAQQANVLDVPWMYTNSNGRQRIEKTDMGVSIAGQQLPFDELVNMARSHPERFTPTVLTRPLVQDAILPTAVTVLGAAEMAYHQQIADVYQLLGVGRPVLIARSGGTMINAKTKRNLLKSGHELEWYARPWQTIEKDLSSELASAVLPNRVQQQATIDNTLDSYVEAAQKIDPTLVATVNAQRAGMHATLDMLESKLTSASKKKNAVVVDRAHAIHASVFPHDTKQERVYPLGMWEADFGIDGLIDACDQIGQHEIGATLLFHAPTHEAQ